MNIKTTRLNARVTQPALAELSGENAKHVNWLETVAGPVPKRVRDKIVGTLSRLRDLQEQWGGRLDMRNVQEVRKLLTAMGDGKPKEIPQDFTIKDIAETCAALGILPVEANTVCGFRTGLLLKAHIFSRPAQRWTTANLVAIRNILGEAGGAGKFFPEYKTRAEAIDALTLQARGRLLNELGAQKILEYETGLRLTGESHAAALEEMAEQRN